MNKIKISKLHFIIGYGNPQQQSPYPNQPPPPATGGMYPNMPGQPNYGVSEKSSF